MAIPGFRSGIMQASFERAGVTMAALSRSAGRRVLAAAACAAGAAALAACSSGTPSPTPTVTVTRSASPAASPAASSAAASTSAPAAGPPECATSGLRVAVGSPNGAAGTIYYNIDFTNTSGSPCVLQGYPGVSLVSKGSDAGSQVGADAKRNPVTAVKAVTVAAGQTAHAALGIAEAGNFTASDCHPVTAHWLKVFPPNQFTAAYVKLTTQTCASTSVPTMHISAVSAGA